MQHDTGARLSGRQTLLGPPDAHAQRGGGGAAGHILCPFVLGAAQATACAMLFPSLRKATDSFAPTSGKDEAVSQRELSQRDVTAPCSF